MSRAGDNQDVGVSAYAELHCVSNFSFLRGASHAEELVARARELGYAALAITDECSLAGVVRAHAAAKKHQGVNPLPFKLLIGAEFRLDCGLRFVVLARNRAGYGRLSRLITRGRRKAQKGSYSLCRADVVEFLADSAAPAPGEHVANGALLLWLPELRATSLGEDEQALWLRANFAGRSWIAVELTRDGRDRERLAMARALGEAHELPLTAAGDVHMHVRERRRLQDALTAVRHGVTVAEAGERLLANGERHLRERDRLARLYPPELLAETVKIASLIDFSLDELRYEYPRELVPAGETAVSHLRKLTEAGARKRWPQGIPDDMRARIEQELTLIGDLAYESYFLTVQDIVAEARRLNILCQGRGSAANSVVCYSLGVTEVDPSRGQLLMERFISRERNEPPDIDIDFEHERREEVIQYIYRKYGRDRTALTAVVICYRPRSALRDMAKVHGTGSGAGRAAGGRHAVVGHRRRRGPHARSGLRSGQPQGAAAAGSHGSAAGLPAASLAARGRVRDFAGAARRAGAHRERGHGRPHGHRMGQGRSRRAGPAQGGRARLSACCRRCGAGWRWSASSAAGRSRSRMCPRKTRASTR